MDGSATLGLGAAAALLVLGSNGLANGALAAASAKAARGGRKCFAAQLGRDAAGRGSLVLDRAVLRRLDRVHPAMRRWIDDALARPHAEHQRFLE